MAWVLRQTLRFDFVLVCKPTSQHISHAFCMTLPRYERVRNIHMSAAAYLPHAQLRLVLSKQAQPAASPCELLALLRIRCDMTRHCPFHRDSHPRR